MANIKSAIKRVEIAERNRLRNKSYKTAVKTLSKKFLASVDQYVAAQTPENEEELKKRMSAVYSKIDKAVKRGVYHPNNGARKKSRLAKAYKRKVETVTSSAS